MESGIRATTSFRGEDWEYGDKTLSFLVFAPEEQQVYSAPRHHGIALRRSAMCRVDERRHAESECVAFDRGVHVVARRVILIGRYVQ